MNIKPILKKVCIIGSCVLLFVGAPLEALASEPLMAKNIFQSAGVNSLVNSSKTVEEYIATAEC